MTVSVRVYPSDDEELVAAARALIAFLGEKAPQETIVETDSPLRHGDWPVYASLVLALPGALLAVARLRDILGSGPKRKELIDRIEPTFAVARAKANEKKSLVLTVNDVTVDLGEAGIDDVLDALAAFEQPTQGDNS